MMNKRKVLISAILAIALCVSLISGATFALFTSKSEVNIAVTSGKVAVTAIVNGDLALSHQEADSAEASGYKTVDGSLYSGTATLDADTQTITIDKMVPMDKISFKISITNESNVSILYRTVIGCSEDDGLFDGLKVTVNDEVFYGEATTDYKQIDAGANIEEVAVSVELPMEAENVFSNKTCKLYYKVEAIQGNAKTDEIHVNASNAQEYLDGKYGSIDGKRIILDAGDYDKLYLRQSLNVSTRREDLEKDSTSYPAYYREFNNVTIKAADGASVTCDGFVVEAGLFFFSSAPASNQEAMGRAESGFISYISLKNIVVEGIEFENAGGTAVLIGDNTGIQQFKGSALYVNGFVVKNCKGTGAIANEYQHFFSAGTGSTDLTFCNVENGVKGLNNIKLINCEMNSYYQPVHFNNNSAILNGFTVSGCTFNDCTNNLIQLSNKQNNGKFVFANNTVNGLNGRFIRMAAAQADTKVTFINNKIVSVTAYDEDGSAAKVTGVAGFSVVESGNDWSVGSFDADNATWIANGK